MALYRGQRTFYGHAVTVDEQALPLRRDLASFAWEFGWGSDDDASMQLALALLAHHLPAAESGLALTLAEDFRRQIVAHFAPRRWALRSEEIADWLFRHPHRLDLLL